MDINEYSKRAIALDIGGEQIDRMIHAAMGISGEGGEVADIVKKLAFAGRKLDRAHLIEELGDVMWYMNLMVDAIGTTWERVMEANINKLETRFPDKKFNADHAINRDLDAEKAAMAQ